jgi:NDP-sugar pyrophosphorylase family protein
MIPADTYLWTVYRDDRELMAAFKRIAQEGVDPKRGYYGIIGHGAVIKHCLIIKDVKVGNAAYIKGVNKLKNLTIKPDIRDPTQIGEGVEMVNGVMGYGRQVFYGDSRKKT